ncbi:hypothetical protein ABKV19_010215 [Rosa sericea]
MAATMVPSVMVNLKALNHDNYEHWSFRVETYLLAEGLWDVVESTNEPPNQEDPKFKDWQKNNAKALHAIHISCGDDAESSISGIKTAREAWIKLAEKFVPREISESYLDSGESSEDRNDNTDSFDVGADVVVGPPVRADETYLPFFNNVSARHWKDVKEFIGQHPEAARARLPAGQTALGYAVSKEDVEGVKELLPFMKETDLKILGDALSTAIKKGSDSDVMIEIIKCIVEKNEKLLLRHDPIHGVPLLLALSGNTPKMVHYLNSVTPLEKLKRSDGAELISTGLRVNRFDISLELLQRKPRWGIARGYSGEFPLYQLASMRARLFLDASQLKIWERWIYNRIYIPPTPTHTRDVSIDVHREEKDQGNQKHLIRKALQMQKELQWFKKVERMARPRDLDCMNSDGRTPREVFTMDHRNLVEAGEKSMKETATSSSALVAALIITIMFASAVTVPGGIKGETGIPIYLHTKAFRIFIVADVISLCSSTTSVMIFLGILTSRFAEEDFLTSLPTKLIIGFLTLFLSIGAMMMAFSSAIYIMLPEKSSIVTPSIVLASVPIASFLWMQFPFLLEIIFST